MSSHVYIQRAAYPPAISLRYDGRSMFVAVYSNFGNQQNDVIDLQFARMSKG